MEHLSNELKAIAFAVYFGLGSIITASLIYAIIKFEDQLKWRTRVAISLVAATTALNTFAQYFPTPYLPWTILLGRFALAWFILECLIHMHRLTRDFHEWQK